MFLCSPVWITALFNLKFPFSLCVGLHMELLYPSNGSQLEIYLVNVAVPALPSIPCDVSPVFLDLPVVMCRTRYSCQGVRRSHRLSAVVISVVYSRATVAVTVVSSCSFKDVAGEYTSSEFLISALGPKGGWDSKEEFWENWDIYKKGLNCIFLLVRSSITVKISINRAVLPSKELLFWNRHNWNDHA